MKSSDLARMTGVTVRTLRHYHAIGLLPEPQRAPNGYRAYSASDVLRVLRIRQLASLGFSLEHIGRMLDDLDAERAQSAGHPTRANATATGAEDLLEDLDHQLEAQISQLQRQRELIRHIRAHQAEPDYPERAARALDAIQAFEQQAHEFGFLLSALTEEDRVAMGIAAHLYSECELAEIERIFRAIPERGLIDEYLQVSRLMDELPTHATCEERERAIKAGMHFLDKISDCMDPANWLRPDKDYELMLERMASDNYNSAQIAVSDELFLRFTKELADRAHDKES